MTLRKYQVFISSTYKLMDAARKAAVAGVSDSLHIPISLDRFAPENSRDLDVIKREVDACHVYILLVGPTYGAVPPGRDKSYTEIEYEIAVEAGRQILVFSLSWEDAKLQRKQLDPEQDLNELDNTKAFKKFYKRVSSGTHFHREWRWTEPEAIRRFVALALTKLPFEEDAPRGLVPESHSWPELVAVPR